MYSGSEWIKQAYKKGMSPLGERVADLLGEWACGIYHLHNPFSIDWSNPNFIEVNYSGSLDTFDNGNLTKLVFLAHWLCVRVEINSCNFRYLKLMFTNRLRDGNLYDRHPTLDEAVERFKKYIIANEVDEFKDSHA